MLRHYLVVALRSFARQRLHSAISVAVLALGLTCFIAAYVFVSHLRGYDRHFANADRIYVVFQGLEWPAQRLSWPSYPWSSWALAEQLALDVPELEAVARYRVGGRAVVTVDGEPRFRRIAYAEPKFLEIFNFDVVAGDLGSALASPQTAIITARTAESLYGTTDVVGRTLSVTDRGRGDATIAAVIADLPSASHLSDGRGNVGFDLLMPWSYGETLAPPFPGQTTWFNMSVVTYVLLPRGGAFTPRDLDERLGQLIERHVPDQGAIVDLRARPVSSVTTGGIQSQFQGLSGSVWRVDIFAMLLLFASVILVISCVNFVNLATARTPARAREVGVRKSVGAATGQLIRQDLFQTTVIVAAAVLVALAALAVAGTFIQEPWRPAFAIPWAEPRLWLFLGVMVVVVTLVAGLYPALLLARARPVAALRGGTVRAGPRALRSLLVGSQFAIASFLLVAVTVLFAQRDNLREAFLGRFEDQYVIFNPLLPGTTGAPALEVLAAEILKGPGIQGVTQGVFPLQAVGGRPQLSRSPGPDQPRVMPESAPIGHDYFAIMEVPLLAGRTFTRDRDDLMPSSEQEMRARTAPPRIVIDRVAARELGWSNPADAVGEIVYEGGRADGALEIIGVVETVPLAIRDRGSAGIMYRLNMAFGMTIVRIANRDVAASRAHIDGVFKTLMPDRPPPFGRFLDQAFEGSYWTFTMVNRVFATLVVFAIAIAGIGLFGMASYMTALRTREIGLRKCQGATAGQILRLLLWDFSRPVVVANVLAWPFAFVAANRYLDVFAERIALTPGPFAIALGGTLVIAWLAVASRVVRAARIRPTEALRYE